MPVAPEHAAGGPVYFAWADADETEFDEGSDGHIRYDEYILSLELDLEEGKLPVLTVEMINPGPAWWLASTRQRWVWVAFDTDTGVQAKFFGRILALPSDMFGAVVTVKFYAKPLDYVARKQTAAEALKVLPFYDKIWIDPVNLDNPDTVLEGYSAVWHHDPVTHAITINDYINGEAGELEFAASEIVHDSLALTLGDPPPRAVKVDAVITYTQAAAGSVDIGGNSFSSYNGQGLVQGWWKPGTALGGGWTVKNSTALDDGASNAQTQTTHYEWKNGEKSHSNSDAMSVSESITKPIGVNYVMIDHKSSVDWTIGDEDTGRAASISIQENATCVLQFNITTALEIEYDARRDRTEHVIFTLALDSQPMLTDADGSDEIETLNFSGADVGQMLPGDDVPPIIDVGRRDFSTTDRGVQTYINRILVARANLLSKARPAEIAFQAVSFSRALEVTCRHTARVHDSRRLPGGEAAGKVVNVKITAAAGAFSGLINAKGAIGNGGEVEAVAGTPTIADADVLDNSVQRFSGRVLILDSADIAFPLPVEGDNDDGLKFPLDYDQVVVRNETIHSAGDTEQDVLQRINGLAAFPEVSTAFGAVGTADNMLNAAGASTSAAQTALEKVTTTYELELKPVGDLSFEYAFDMGDLTLKLEKQVDLSGGV